MSLKRMALVIDGKNIHLALVRSVDAAYWVNNVVYLSIYIGYLFRNNIIFLSRINELVRLTTASNFFNFIYSIMPVLSYNFS